MMKQLVEHMSEQEIRYRLRTIHMCDSDETSLFFLYLQKNGGIAAIDIDGVLCEEGDEYAKRRFLSPIPKHNCKYTILYTARLECDREVTEAWLKENGIMYDALITNKLPYSILYDDKARQGG